MSLLRIDVKSELLSKRLRDFRMRKVQNLTDSGLAEQAHSVLLRPDGGIFLIVQISWGLQGMRSFRISFIFMTENFILVLFFFRKLHIVFHALKSHLFYYLFIKMPLCCITHIHFSSCLLFPANHTCFALVS